MASIRRGYSDDFTLNNNSVGIGTSVGQEALDVVDGSVKGQDLKVTGISSFTAHEGFLRADHQIAENTTLSFDQGPSASLSGEIIVGTGVTVTIDNLPDGDFGPELITNGSFISTTSGWTAYNAVISISNEQLKVDDSADAGSWSSAVQEVNTEPGVKYRLEVGIGTETEGSIYGYYNGRYPSAGTAPYYQSNRHDPVGIVTDVYEFVASEKITSILLTANNDGISHYDNVSLKKINVPEEPRAGGSEIECLKVFNTFTPPSGGTNERPYASKPGELYYNYDFKTIEFFDGNGWRQVDNTTRSGRMLNGGGVTPSNTDRIQSININTFGNSVDFGILTAARSNVTSLSSATRGVWAGGTYVDTIDYVTIASGGTGADFGNLSTTNRGYLSGASSSTRGLFGGGYTTSPSPATVDVIDYIEIGTLGNALDFGNLFVGRYSAAAVSNGVRAVWGGGMDPPTKSTIDYVTISSKGNALKFGDLTAARRMLAESACSNNVRGIFAGGQQPVLLSVMDYITIATEGNAVYFGDLTEARTRSASSSTNTRGLWAGGLNPNNSNVIDYANISSTGNAQDFGDLNLATGAAGGCSDSHGGLGGF